MNFGFDKLYVEKRLVEFGFNLSKRGKEEKERRRLLSKNFLRISYDHS
jgi:hypothetical protein